MKIKKLKKYLFLKLYMTKNLKELCIVQVEIILRVCASWPRGTLYGNVFLIICKITFFTLNYI